MKLFSKNFILIPSVYSELLKFESATLKIYNYISYQEMGFSVILNFKDCSSSPTEKPFYGLRTFDGFM